MYQESSRNNSSLTHDTISVSPPTPPASGPTIGPHNESSHTLDSSTTVPEKDDRHASNIPSLSTFRLLMAHIGAALTLFLATTDSTIVSTSLPSISSDLDATSSQYTWVGVAYLLTQTAFQPLYGKISDLVGRKILLHVSIIIFAVGSLLCGLAKTINMLIVSRALAGIGGGGIVSCVWVITSEIVEERQRAKWSQALSVTWSCSAIAGPLLGGLFSGASSNSINWRWCFFLNLPVCLVGALVLSVSLRGVNFQKNSDLSCRTFLQRFDFGGLILFMGGTSCIIVGLNFASERGWKAPATIVPLCLGVLVLAWGGFYEARTTRQSLFPPTLFSNFTAVLILVITFLHNVVFNAGTFYLALFFQAADGYTPLESGIRMLPYSLGSSLASIPAAWFIGCWQKRTQDTTGQKLVITTGFLLSAVGFGLLILLDENSSTVLQTVFPLICGIGLGTLFHAPYQIFVKAFDSSEIATVTGAFFLVRFTAATVGITIAGAIFDARTSRLPPEVYSLFPDSSIDYGKLHSIFPINLRDEVLHLVSLAFQTVWMVCAPLLGIAFLMSLLLRTQELPETTENSVKDFNAKTEKSRQASAEAQV
ncbi:amino acid permease ScVBA-like protein [Dendrothele bispora CBS 962.96]|uniref:Amino acid permease ScVBA-like protein n=1 Tax=Dendrothele bispora (strain CBS 962.96) TaxID=1314807 RepID=A0A4S8MSF4_DENBC|nr:amino acid permease ScVBA-like protein [Dendrothele bispora CBS 962.96]